MDNGVRCFVEKYIPYFLHGSASSLDIVLKWVILPSDIHHKSWDEGATPGKTIDLLWKVSILEFFVALCHFGFLFDNEFLVQMLVQLFISK
jgi:hypothetical protein